MPTLKLTYFDIDGGRGEPARIALHSGGLVFEDERLSFAQWSSRKASTPYGGMPVLEVDGHSVAQSNAINRYVGKLVGLYPEDPWQAALCDETMDAIEAIGVQVIQTLSIREEAEKKRAREALAKGPLSFYLTALGARLEARGGLWFADQRLTMADLRVFVWTRTLCSGVLEHVPADLAQQVAPALAEHAERVRLHPKVAAYYASRAS